MRTRVLCRGKKNYSANKRRALLEKLSLAPWASRRRQELLELLENVGMNWTIAELTAAVEREARKRPEVLRLMTHPGVGPLTALAYVLIIGTPSRFPVARQIGTYVGMIPSEDSSAGKQPGWGTSASKAVLCCGSCWWRQPKQQRVTILTGDVGTSTWRCVGTRVRIRQGSGW